MKEILKKNQAITLVSLVVTIIVLIILAGVSINLILGEKGIITIAKQAKENTELAKIEEETRLNELYMQIETEGISTGDTSYDAIAKLVEFKREIASAITDMGIETSESASVDTMASNIRSIVGASSADKVSYNNTNSGLEATNVQGAVDEVNARLQANNWKSVDVNLSVSSVSVSYSTKIVPELAGAKEVYYKFHDDEKAHFINVDNGRHEFTHSFKNSNFDSGDIWDSVVTTYINFSIGEVGLRTNIKGSAQNFPSISKIYYR